MKSLNAEEIPEPAFPADWLSYDLEMQCLDEVNDILFSQSWRVPSNRQLFRVEQQQILDLKWCISHDLNRVRDHIRNTEEDRVHASDWEESFATRKKIKPRNKLQTVRKVKETRLTDESGE